MEMNVLESFSLKVRIFGNIELIHHAVELLSFKTVFSHFSTAFYSSL